MASASALASGLMLFRFEFTVKSKAVCSARLSILGIMLSLLGTNRVNMVTLKQAQCCSQVAGVVIEGDGQQCHKQTPLELSQLVRRRCATCGGGCRHSAAVAGCGG